jgi:PadR family transcriptional regulator, regulatory protein PadR
MPRDAGRGGLVKGTLDLLILRTLLVSPCHGHGIAKHIQRRTEDVLLVEHGSLYPALARLEKSGSITSRWEKNEQGREMRIYRLTPTGRKRLAKEESKWKELARAMTRMLRPV